MLQVRCAVYNGALGSGSINGSSPSAVQMQLSQSPRDPTSFLTLPVRAVFLNMALEMTKENCVLKHLSGLS